MFKKGSSGRLFNNAPDFCFATEKNANNIYADEAKKILYMTIAEFKHLFATQPAAKEAAETGNKAVCLEGLSGSALSLLIDHVSTAREGIHIAVMDDRDGAAYLYNDLLALSEEKGSGQIFFFPTAYKHSILYRQEDPSGIVQRTACLNAVQHNKEKFLVICTYPEAIAEKVAARENLEKNSISLKTGDKISIDFLIENLVEYRFEKVDFIYEPGQYSVRGGIVDVFSFSDNKPYRIDFFGDEIDSIRSFNINSQLSVEKLEEITIVPNLRNDLFGQRRESLMDFVAEDKDACITYWIDSPDHSIKRLQEIRVKMLKDAAQKGDAPQKVNEEVTGSKEFVEKISLHRVFTCRGDFKENPAQQTISFQTAPQPAFNKNFDLLAGNITRNAENGYRTFILTPNKAQVERLDNIFHSIGKSGVPFENIPVVLHRGFIDNTLRCCFYTDHQLFDRYHRYQLRNELEKSDRLTLKELNALQIGDYVVHIDHGIGRFGGLVRSVENGKVQESIKLTYRDNDVLLVNVHALHRISKYKDKDSEPPKIHKLGSGAWQRMKLMTKSKVKDIAKDLIALYAKRQATKGFAFSEDSYLQHELEASFLYEDTPDQQKATQAVKEDMESDVPMDRLICGDVGFGKTEIAIRAAFKAVTDGKQVAVLVPTTVLSLQHYRTFNDRLKEFPVRIEHFTRAKTAKQTAEILADLKAGKIDILIGTHKLLGSKVEFKDLGLLIIDEEQKFGVSSKEKLRRLRENVDTLTLTATPIPRTLQFSLMGARDLSIINTPPPNRQPVATESLVFSEELIRDAIQQELSRQGQVFFVHNRVQDIERVQGMVNRLCPDARTAVVHGQMPSEKLEKIMLDFIYGEYDVLITTTIIESGLDIPNANTILINNAQNFGLSELHQLRGRVGRTNRKAYCYLLTPPEEVLSDTARRRLRAIEEFADLGAGFNIAMQDLDIRGAGNLLGAEQSGFIADIGFETYQKILQEAILELKDEQAGLFAATSETGEKAGMPAEEKKEGTKPAAQQVYITDCYIDTDREAVIPDAYVSNTAEKIRLYRELDSMTTEAQMKTFESQLVDRFGEIPEPVRELLNIVLIRQTCIRLGFERVILKNGVAILQFVQNQASNYYKSPLFSAILKFVSEQGDRFKLKNTPAKLSLFVRNVKNSGEALQTVKQIAESTGI